ncbi:cytotoxic T-lymphocyte protein 4-like [Anomaloglossus baeobatrachus]|uniref:cytotoxic T-lymphocyte protein 4-like n=1 Tax=Anomaloglossus baeobatrachus TaxID=238106 RepID=UPI003F4FA37B
MVTWIYAAFYLFLRNMAVAETITQEPRTLTLPKMDTARISCHWTDEGARQVRVEWRKQISSTGEDNGTVLCSVLKTEQHRNSSVRNNNITCSVTNNTALLTIEGVTEDDGGRYICKVTGEIPKLYKAEGNGTQLYVQDSNNGVFVLDIRFLYLTAILIIPILIVVCCLYCKRKKKKELFLDHIYGNVKRNTSSRNRKTTIKRDKKKMSV